MPALRIVVAEDDAAIRQLLVHHLTREGFRCIETGDGPSTLRAVRAGTDLVILDVGLPVVDGFDIVRTLRREGRGLPIVMVTARSDEVDRVIGLELGADDYVIKPFSPRELIARVRALARRGGIVPDAAPALLRFDRWKLMKRPAKCVSTAPTSRSNRASSRSCCNWRAILAWHSRASRCCKPFGVSTSTATNVPSTCTSAGCAPGSKTKRSCRGWFRRSTGLA
jgi:CheY-like chemotaxis protein